MAGKAIRVGSDRASMQRRADPAPTIAVLSTEPTMLEIHCLTSREAFFAPEIDRLRTEWAADDARTAAALDGAAVLDGHCELCAQPTRFALVGGAEPNWRESQGCAPCGLISRVRYAFLLADLPSLRGSGAIYMTEQTTPAYFWLLKAGFDVIGSEYVEDPARRELLSNYIRTMTGGLETRLRHEDVTRLGFPDARFDRLFSFDVLEHVPDHRAALREFARVLKPGGLAIVTVPFDVNAAASLRRASIGAGGAVVHHVEPEYHGDPVADAGCLAFHTFSWDLLGDFRDAGFDTVELVLGRDASGGLRGLQLAIVASKRAR
jgi:SAM-dependent methyltransferase